MPGFARLSLCLVLLLATAAGPARATGETIVFVEPDVEIALRDGESALPSAARSDAFVRRWPLAAARALRVEGPARAWVPEDDPTDDEALAQMLALQDAVSRALLEPDVRPRALSLGPGTARLAAATGATHALFARVRAAPRRGTAVALLADLRTGEVRHYRVRRNPDARIDAEDLADRLADDLLGGWRDLPPFAAATVREHPAAAPRSDIARASARLAGTLRRHPLRVVDPELEATVRDVGCRLDAAACAAPRPVVLRDPTPYAAMLPGGALVIHTGLLLRLPDEAALAFLLAHEWAHERRGDTQARLDAGAAGRHGAAARAAETAADEAALAMMAAAGYDPGAAVALWERLRDDPAAGLVAAGSHPPTEDRLAAARAAARSAQGGERGADRWQRVIGPRRGQWTAASDPAEPGVGATPSPASGGPRVREVRTLGLRLRTTLPWRQRPGIGAVEWTVDGTPLNRLVVATGIAAGEPMLPDAAGRTPRWNGATDPVQITSSIVATLRHAGWLVVEATGRRDHDFGGLAGARAELTLADENGLHYRGTLAQVVRGGRLTWVAWIAPAAVYHPRDAADVAGMLDGMRFGR